MATNKESILYPEKINNLVQRPVLHWGDLYQMEKEGCLSPDNPNIIRASRILGFNIWEIIKQAREKINSQDPRNNLTERVNQSVELFRILTLIPSLRENLQLPNKKDLSFKSRIELEITETSFLAAIYFWYYQEGGQRTLEEAVPHPRAFTEYGLFKAAEKALCLISDSTERTMVYISRKAGVDCAESVAILRDYFKEFDWDISTTPEEKQKSKFSLRKRPKDLPGVLKAITGLTILLGSLTGSGRVDQKTLRTALILKEAIATANSFAEGPTNPHEENKPSSSLTSSKTDILSNDQEWFRNAITQTTTPLEIPPQITVTGQDGETGPAPEISIEKNEAFHVVEPGEWLSKIVKEYWYKKDAEGPMVARFTRVLLMINPHLGNDPNKIEVGKRVFLYPEQMKGKFAEVLAFLLEGKGKLEDLEELIKDLAIPTIGSQDELGPASKKGEWIIYENKEQLPLEAIVRLYFGAFGEKSLALINRINHMRMDGQGVIPWLVLPPEGWWVFQIENNPFPPAIAIPQISTDLQAPIRQPEVKKNSPEPKATVTTASKESTYTVKKGDTLLAIAQRFGTTVSAIAGANAIQNPNKIFVGKNLKIPKGATPVESKTNYQEDKKNIPNIPEKDPVSEELKKYLRGNYESWNDVPKTLKGGLPTPP